MASTGSAVTSVGGFVGAIVANAASKLTINGTCSNGSAVNGNSDNVGGILGGTSGAADTSSSISGTVTNNGTVDGTYYVGGIIGGIAASSGFSVAATNTAAVTASSVDTYAYAGGIIGGNNGTLTLNACTNRGAVRGDAGGGVGGIVGYTASKITLSGNLTNQNNSGTVAAQTGAITGAGDGVGGIVGYWNAGGAGAASNDAITLTNSGAVKVTSASTQQYVGGIIGYLVGDYTVKESVNSGAIGTATSNEYHNYTGGIVGTLTGAFTPGTKATNKGSVYGNIYVGGVVGYAPSTVTLAETTSESAITIKGTALVGGVVGGAVGAITASKNSVTSGSITVIADGSYYIKLSDGSLSAASADGERTSPT